MILLSIAPMFPDGTIGDHAEHEARTVVELAPVIAAAVEKLEAGIVDDGDRADALDLTISLRP